MPLATASVHVSCRFERELAARISIDRASNDLLKDSSSARDFGTSRECATWNVVNQRTKMVNCWIRCLIQVSLDITFRFMDSFYHACKSVAAATTTLFHCKIVNILNWIRGGASYLTKYSFLYEFDGQASIPYNTLYDLVHLYGTPPCITLRKLDSESDIRLSLRLNSRVRPCFNESKSDLLKNILPRVAIEYHIVS